MGQLKELGNSLLGKFGMSARQLQGREGRGEHGVGIIALGVRSYDAFARARCSTPTPAGHANQFLTLPHQPGLSYTHTSRGHAIGFLA